MVPALRLPSPQLMVATTPVPGCRYRVVKVATPPENAAPSTAAADTAWTLNDEYVYVVSTTPLFEADGSTGAAARRAKPSLGRKAGVPKSTVTAPLPSVVHWAQLGVRLP